MKYLTLTLALAAATFSLAACETAHTDKSGASMAAPRTAGEAGTAPKAKKQSTSMFKSYQSK